MHRTDANGNVGNLFDPGDPNVPRLPTAIDTAIMNAIQEELCNAVQSDGTALVKGEWFQLRGALAMLLPSPGGRLTLTTGTPVTTGDVTGATTVYYTPYKHARIAVYDGARWHFYGFSEMSQALSDATKSPAAAVASSCYDVFVWSDGGTLRATRGPAWASDTSRGSGAGTTELEFFGSRWVNKNAIANGPAARCGTYVGTIRTDGSAQVNDSLAKRHVWNAHNRVRRPMRVVESTDSWIYTLAALRPANGNSANQLDFVIGLDEDLVRARTYGQYANSSANIYAYNAIGLDSTTAFVTGCMISGGSNSVINILTSIASEWGGNPGIGRHYLAWLEASAPSGTCTFYGDFGGPAPQGGIVGELSA